MQHVDPPTLMEGEIVFHAATGTIGKVLKTIYPASNKLKDFEQVLVLLDGTQRTFRFVELRPANSVQAREFLRPLANLQTTTGETAAASG